MCGSQFDRHSTVKVSVRFLLSAFAGCALICFTKISHLAVMYASLLLLGVGLAVATVGIPIWAAGFSTPKSYPKMLKRFQLSYSIGSTVFSVIPGIIYDWTGSYRSAYALMAAMIFATILLLKTAYQMRSTG